jgi:protein-disulfide isomerase
MFARRLKRLVVAMGFGVLSTALVGASCSKKDGAVEPSPPAAAADAKPPRPDAKVAQEEDIPGVDLAGLSPDEQQQFFRLLDAAPSPCGKAQSLRASVKSDKTCKRAPFAARYARKLATLGGEDEQVLELYKKRYQEQTKNQEFDVTGAPYEGTPDAPVKIIEFFDYSCPHCKLALPVLEDAVVHYPSDVVVYFMHFPLGGAGHPNSLFLARAAVAAMRQGKFREMHKKLFSLQDKGDQSEPAIQQAAKDIGLDMTKFQADYNDPKTAAFVEAQRKQAEKAEIDGTPAIYINGRTYSDPHEYEWLKSWIDEEIAVQK